MKKFIFITLTLVLLLQTKITAQKLSSSPFSRYGIGELYFQGNGRQIAMGNTGIGDFNSSYISKLNPASISSIRPNSVIFEVDVFHKLSEYSTAQEKQSNNITNFRQVIGGFRIFPWWHTAMGINPLSGIGYKITADIPIADDDAKYTGIYEGKGGINQLFWTNSFSFLKYLSLGINVNYNFGSTDKQTTLAIEEKDYTSISVNYKRNLIKKFNYDFGIIFRDTIKKDEYSNILKYSLGAVFSNSYDIKTTQTQYISRSISLFKNRFSDTILLDTIGNSIINMPTTIGFGTSLNFYDKLTVTGDYVVRKWKDSNILDEKNFTNANYIALGAEFVIEPVSSKFYRTIRYRVGAYKDNSYIMFNNKQLVTQAVTMGVGFPVKSILLNIGFVYGRTGSVDIGLKENFYQLNLNISMYDFWFVKRKFM